MIFCPCTSENSCNLAELKNTEVTPGNAYMNEMLQWNYNFKLFHLWILMTNCYKHYMIITKMHLSWIEFCSTYAMQDIWLIMLIPNLLLYTCIMYWWSTNQVQTAPRSVYVYVSWCIDLLTSRNIFSTEHIHCN